MAGNTTQWPTIIQGGMGVGVSSWQLAKAVAEHGQLGVISGTAVAVTFARRMRDGDPDGTLNAALDAFPFPAMAQRIRERHKEGHGTSQQDKYRGTPMPRIDSNAAYLELTVVASFAEVWRAKQGHDGVVGVNLLEKIQIPTVPSLYGAILAGVDYVLMGAGIPIRIPAIIDALTRHEDARLPIKISGDTTQDTTYASFSPQTFAAGELLPTLTRPNFLAIVSSHTLAKHLAGSSYGSPDGFIVEAPIAGGHNAPPRGKMALNDVGEPVYGSRDEVDLEQIADLGKPYWLAGGYGRAEQVKQARERGAAGVQVGTAFAFCDESGLDATVKAQVIKAVINGEARVRTDPLASPTGFPFKVVELPGTIGEPAVGEARQRICDLGYLREPYRTPTGSIGYRCASEPVDDYVKKGGDIADTVGRRCLCNGLVTSNGLGQIRRDGSEELPIVTAGDDLIDVTRFLKDGATSYTAADVLQELLAHVGNPAVA
ncbi:MAG: nitronate monooxygenase [Nitriliruptoraceae bacterium]